MWPFWKDGYFPANQSYLKTFPKALMAGKKPALQKNHFCFGHVNPEVYKITASAAQLPNCILLHA